VTFVTSIPAVRVVPLTVHQSSMPSSRRRSSSCSSTRSRSSSSSSNHCRIHSSCCLIFSFSSQCSSCNLTSKHSIKVH